MRASALIGTMRSGRRSSVVAAWSRDTRNFLEGQIPARTRIGAKSEDGGRSQWAGAGSASDDAGQITSGEFAVVVIPLMLGRSVCEAGQSMSFATCVSRSIAAVS